MSGPKFQRLLRFRSESGNIHFVEVPENHPWEKELIGTEVFIYYGNSPLDRNLILSDRKAIVKEVLAPFADVPFIYGVGLNFRKHVEESGVNALAGPYEDIHVHHTAKDLDYEGELIVVIGKDVKNLPNDANALDYVLGYTIGNDLSSRWWQEATKGAQSNYAKSFDQFAPLGPVLVSTNVIPDPAVLTFRTHMNGEKRQESGIDDLIFDVSAIVWFFSQGRTLRKGSVIMTGTPFGVGSFLPGGPKYLKDGDDVEIEISQIGNMRNKFVIDQ
ncbi:fumarylacetoacetate hydrolase family protein [Penicillium malachiteum]|uniref:fumarylacetoacetate hydrolase family protein n=1 Tax=Penicillium malachiteum TaxID=1324776 RepID=UPI0025475594|nr:fumarylacetoacetate hydrolase family protein [Penicillium malachiteum]KAJ5721027.1 fumarylacetoacetate hydrolase family protein [Penicillium malachiteum]